MKYEFLEELEGISPELYRAIGFEQEISDLLFFGYSCMSPEVQLCYFDKKEVDGAVNKDKFSRLVVGAVGKELWKQRVCSSKNPEYSRSIYKEVTDNLWLLVDELSEREIELACIVLDHVDLPKEEVGGHGTLLAAAI